MIRDAGIKDSLRMAEIHVSGWRCAYRDFISMEFLINKRTVKDSEEKFIEYLSKENDDEKTFVYEESNMIKAFMTIGNCRDEDKDEKTFELCGIYVDPLFQRQKIGTELVDYCIQEAKKQNKKEITLWVFEKNSASIQFYNKMGFNADGKIKVMERYGVKAIRMIKKL